MSASASSQDNNSPGWHIGFISRNALISHLTQQYYGLAKLLSPYRRGFMTFKAVGILIGSALAVKLKPKQYRSHLALVAQ